MSHITKIKVEIRDLNVLKDACARLDFEFKEGQKKINWWGVYVGDSPLPEGVDASYLGKCDHAIKVPNAKYEIGVTQKGDTYELLYDSWYSGGLADALGPNAEKLIQAYAVEAAKAEAQRQGYSVYEESLQDGSVQLNIQVED
ncbi:MAG: DUF1257 domain-containing protein [Eubacteriales bacterium]|jgi:hypothetical protein